MIRRPPRSTRTDTLFPYTTLFRSRRTSRPSGQRHARAPSLRYSNAQNFPFKHDARLRLHTFIHVLAQRLYVGAACSTEIEEGVAMLFRTLRRASLAATAARSEERRVGQACVGTCRARWSALHE